jgi:hypothetical protein
MPPRGSCESYWHLQQPLNSASAIFIILFGFLTFISDHRCSAVRLAGALLFLNGGFSFACHFGISWSPMLEDATCTLDGSSMLVPAAVICSALADLVLERVFHGEDARRERHRVKGLGQMLFKGFIGSLIAFILCLGMIGQVGLNCFVWLILSLISCLFA